MPEILPAKKRGLTTQNWVPSVSSGLASCVVAIVTTTCALSGVSSRLFTVPNTMSLYLSCDWPACSPSPLSKVTLIVGPSLDSVSHASQAPIATATSGMIQMIDSRRERRAVACGTARCSARLVMASPLFLGLPQQGTEYLNQPFENASVVIMVCSFTANHHGNALPGSTRDVELGCSSTGASDERAVDENALKLFSAGSLLSTALA